MLAEKKLGFIFAACLVIILCASTSYGIYFTIQLKNGNEIITDQYIDDNRTTIHFYTNEGAVTLPKATIKSIKSNDGSVSVDIEESEQKKYESPSTDEEAAGQPAQPPRDATDKERLNSIHDQLTVINANLDNLDKNKVIFATQMEQMQQQKQKSEQRIEFLQKSPDAGMRDVKEAIELEQTKLKDLESRMLDMQQRIKNNDQMYEAQQRIKKRFEDDLAKLKK